jgi:hypothetical protein
MSQENGPLFESPFYETACDDPECPVAYAYRDPFPDVPHYHPRPHGPDRPDP